MNPSAAGYCKLIKHFVIQIQQNTVELNYLSSSLLVITFNTG